MEEGHGVPPVAFDIVFKFYAVLAVVVYGREAVVNFTGGKDETVFLCMGYDFLEYIVLLSHGSIVNCLVVS